MHTEIVKVTPDLAKKWLDQNTRNRNISRRKIKQYKDDMEHDRWSQTHQGIAFYETGELSDGQHRLIAIVEAGRSIDMMVTRGVPIDAGADIDRHRPRGDTDSIKIGGLSNWIGKDEVSLIKMIAYAHQRTSPTYSAKHIADLGEFLKDPVTFTLLVFSTRKKYITTSPVLAAVAIASQHVDQNRLMEFAEVMVTGVPQSMDDVAAIRLREQLIAEQGRGGQTARRNMLHKSMRAIKAFVEREQIQKLYTPQDMIWRIEGIEAHL